MRHISLKQHRTGRILFQGYFTDIRAALEQAITEKINLNGLYLEGIDLSRANLDNAQLAHSVFHHCDLTRTNLSETILNQARFLDCDLSDSCLAYTYLRQTILIDTPLAHTELAGAHIENCVFNCPTALQLNYTTCRHFRNCVYIHDNRVYCPIHTQPITIQGLQYDITFMRDHIKIGCFVRRYDQIDPIDGKIVARLFGEDSQKFQEDYAPTLKAVIQLITASNRQRVMDKPGSA